MARYVATADVEVDGLAFPRGSILNIPTSVVPLNSLAALGDAVPRVRVAGLEHDYPNRYLAVPATEQLGYQTADGALPEEGTIKEPVLPAANTQYD
jgi:hypothetical protein